ncbi:MAG: aminodeoxychorismate synthase component I [Acidobacteria bacterium]|nr:aminodeoxychorismate synthase component I [Acidobacteriota bacterium]
MISSVAHCTLNLGLEEILAFILQLPSVNYPCLLDSCNYQDYGLYKGRYLIAAYRPETSLQIVDNNSYLLSSREEKIINGNAMAFLDEVLDDWKANNGILEEYLPDDLPCINGAAIGLFSYDLGRYFENIPKISKINHFVPDLFLSFYSVLIIYDYLQNKATLITCSKKTNQASLRLKAVLAELEQKKSTPKLKTNNQNLKSYRYKSTFTKESYISAVERIKAYIKAGDIYQANLTQQFQFDLTSVDASEIFLKIRENFPVPFACYLKTPSWSVVSASPECFLKQQKQNIAAFPIKGTRPRGFDDQSDNQLAKELINSEKDIAENIMIVDLLRNDLGRVSEIGSIDASKILSLQTLPTLFHLVSKVSGRLCKEIKLSDLLRATFPCGSITGAPKLRAMEILEEIEPTRRGLSMGAIGWVGYNGDLELNVAIRTLFIENNIGYFNVGGGITADSDPLAEYQESLVKAQAMFQAIGLEL